MLFGDFAAEEQAAVHLQRPRLKIGVRQLEAPRLQKIIYKVRDIARAIAP
jgi:hypothetical protein